MTKITITIPNGIEYLTDWKDCYGNYQFGYNIGKGRIILDKGKTGCAFTTWVLVNNEHSILVSPRIALIKNKLKSHCNCFYFNQVIDKNKLAYDFSVYMQNNHPLKLLVTYDSFDKLADLLESYKYDINQFRICIDECHCLIKDAYMKENPDRFVLSRLLTRLFKYENLLFASATPIASYLAKIKEFQNSNCVFYELEWPNIEPTVMLPKSCKNAVDAFDDIYNVYNKQYDCNGRHVFDIQYFIGGSIYSYEACIFLNSVSDICKILKKYALSHTDVTIICGDTSNNRTKLRNVNSKYKIATDIPGKGQPRSTWTFVTRTSFEGTDFWSDNASTFIIADYRVASLQLDIASDIPQIVGRQRDKTNIFRNTIHIYYKNNKNCITDAEFIAHQQESLQESNNQIELFNIAQTPSHKKTQLENIRRYIEDCNRKSISCYLRVIKGFPEINNLIMVAELYSHDILKNHQAWFLPNLSNTSVYSPQVEQLKLDLYYCTQGTTAKIRMIYNLLDANSSLFDDTFKMLHDNGDDEIAGLFYSINLERIKANGYDYWKIQQEIQQEIQYMQSKDQIRNDILSRLPPGNVYSKKEVKEQLQEIYNSHSLSRTAKSTDLGGLGIKTEVAKKNGIHAIKIIG